MSEPTLASPSFKIGLTFDRVINYAFQQNAIPVVKELLICNDATPRLNLAIRIATEPAFAEPIELRLQSLGAMGEHRISPIDLKLNPIFLAELNERVAGLLRVEIVELRNEDGAALVVHSVTESISLLARHEWCGLVALPEILAAFVLPNDPAVMTLLSRAAEILALNTGRAALNGYQDKNRKRAWEQMAAIYKAISELGLRYIAPPASFENTGQKVRFPSDILAQRFGTCLDLALLFAACCEQAGLHPLLLMHEGHMYAGCWLEERTLPEPAIDDLQQIRKLATDNLIVAFEVTLVTDERPGNLSDAERLARPHLETERPFRLALDVRRSRLAQIRPLPIAGHGVKSEATADVKRGTATEAGLGDREFSEVVTPVPNAAPKPATRIDQWKSRLLDLSLRNRLLNFKATKLTIPILSAAPEHVEDELAAEIELSLHPKPKLMGGEDPRNAETYTRQQRADALADHLRDELKHHRLHSALEAAEHASRLTELYRGARVAMEENGTNTLYAAVGVLEWRETEHGDRVLRAPILLVPVELKRKSVLEGFTLHRIDEETRLNVTLMEMLRQQFQKEIPGLDPLPEDASGVNVPLVFKLFRDAVRDLAGWEVKAEIWLSQFSFTKFLLWKDLSDRLDELTRNRVVHHLIHDAGRQYPNPPNDIRPEHLDDGFHPREIFCPRSADSSQLAAVLAAAAGHDFVLEGPPGTGKSQTITNIIAHCLANGKRVLFVAEKRAALDVVHRRLRDEGLEPFCLELHSNKTGKADVVAQFDRSLKFIADTDSADWERRSLELERVRSALNSYTRALHTRHACGLSAYQCLDYLLPRQKEPTVRLDAWPKLIQTTTDTLERAREVSRLLQERSRPLMPLASHPLAALRCVDWSPAWADRLLELISELTRLNQEAAEAAHELLTWTGSTSNGGTRVELRHLHALTKLLLAPQPVGSGFATTTWDQLSPDLDRWIALAEERADLRIKISALLEPPQLSSGQSLHRGEVPLVCEGWSHPDATRILASGRELGGLIESASAAFADLRKLFNWLPTTATRSKLIHFRALTESVLTPLPVGSTFATTAWDELAVDLGEWIAHAQERVELRAKLGGILKERTQRFDEITGLPRIQQACEDWTEVEAEHIFARGRELLGLVQVAREAASDLHEWLLLPRSNVSRAELVPLIGLVDNLLGPFPVGPAFATASWNEIAVALDQWLALARERDALRVELKGYDESKLLALDLDGLQQRWSKAQATWFLPKWWHANAVRGQLQPARADHNKPDRDGIEASLKAAIRLRAIKKSLSNATNLAGSYLGEVWNNCEPKPDMLTEVRVWGESLHERMAACAGDDQNWLHHLKQLIAGLFKSGPGSYAVGTPVGKKLNRYRDAITQFDEAFNEFDEHVHFKRATLDTAPDHLGTIATTLIGFQQSVNRLRTINGSFSANAAKAQACLGSIWNSGEPDVAALLKTQAWGKRLHANMSDCAGDERAWLGFMRQLLARLIEEIQRGKGLDNPPSICLGNYVEKFKAFDEAFTAFKSETGLACGRLDDADDYFTAIDGALRSFVDSASRLRTIDSGLTSASPTAQACLGRVWNKGEPVVAELKETYQWGRALHSSMVGCAGDNLTWLSHLRQVLGSLFAEGPTAYAPGTSIGNHLTGYRDSFERYDRAYEQFAEEVHLERPAFDGSTNHLIVVKTFLEQLPAAWPKLRLWCSWQQVRREGAQLGLSAVIEMLETIEAQTVDVAGLFERSFRRALFFAIIDKEPVLRDFFGREHGERIDRFRHLDELMAGLTRELIRTRLAAGIPRDQEMHDIPKTELGLLRKEIGKKARHIPVRQLLGRIPKLLPHLKPCVLMSPLSVAQYLEPSHETFDVVIFDEASQIPVWDAVGAIARGKQLIVVGDPKQLPPTNFFNTADDVEDVGGELALEKDLESILDELLTNGLRHKRLKWHYRSRHEGLIAFSNHQYYENELLTFPSPESAQGGVRFRHLSEARYDKGKSRTNMGEARALVDELVRRLRQSDGPPRSYGVVTFSQAQQNLVENLLDEERRKFPELEVHFNDAPPVDGEAVFVKNLENVQGDERDVILFSICYGPDESGRVSMNFGPLNRDGGERRLNVAITRAKHEVIVFSSLRGEQIDLNRTRARGVRDLKYFLDYAERGPRALIAATNTSPDAVPDSEFERMVADRIRACGYEVHHQVGCSGYRIDLGVVDPRAPGRYLLGVECDGATYHRAATARDRDKLRQMILEGLGWELHRIWSTDWWHDATAETEKLAARLGALATPES